MGWFVIFTTNTDLGYLTGELIDQTRRIVGFYSFAKKLTNYL